MGEGNSKGSQRSDSLKKLYETKEFVGAVIVIAVSFIMPNALSRLLGWGNWEGILAGGLLIICEITATVLVLFARFQKQVNQSIDELHKNLTFSLPIYQSITSLEEKESIQGSIMDIISGLHKTNDYPLLRLLLKEELRGIADRFHTLDQENVYPKSATLTPGDVGNLYGKLIGRLHSGDRYQAISYLDFWSPAVLGDYQSFIEANRHAIENGITIERIFILFRTYSDLNPIEQKIIMGHRKLNNDHATISVIRMKKVWQNGKALLEEKDRKKFVEKYPNLSITTLSESNEALVIVGKYDNNHRLLTLDFTCDSSNVLESKQLWEEVSSHDLWSIDKYMAHDK